MQQAVDSLVSEQDEADDLIATLAIKVALRGQNVTIISTDKGFLSLLNKNIKVYDYFNRRYLDEQYVEGKFNVKPGQLIDFWALAGDTTNKFPGAAGIGQVTASTLLQKYGSLKAILEAKDLKANIRDKLDESIEAIEISRQLASLKQDIPLGFNLKDIRLTQEHHCLHTVHSN